ncbi:hypothetical protein QFZ64_006990 [Streptomyces sp. B3I8]|nr:hypothetical protein [Streptomyces sp. B3I8]
MSARVPTNPRRSRHRHLPSRGAAALRKTPTWPTKRTNRDGPARTTHRRGHPRTTEPDRVDAPAHRQGLEPDVVQRTCPERVQLFVQGRADPGHLALGHPDVGAEGFDQVVDRPGGHTVDLCLHDHRVEGLIDAPSALRGGWGRSFRPAVAGSRVRGRPPAWSRSSPGGRCAGWCGCRCVRPTRRRSLWWPRPRSVPAVGGHRPAAVRAVLRLSPCCPHRAGDRIQERRCIPVTAGRTALTRAKRTDPVASSGTALASASACRAVVHLLHGFMGNLRTVRPPGWLT